MLKRAVDVREWMIYEFRWNIILEWEAVCGINTIELNRVADETVFVELAAIFE